VPAASVVSGVTATVTTAVSNGMTTARRSAGSGDLAVTVPWTSALRI